MLQGYCHTHYCSTYVLVAQLEQHVRHAAPYIPNLQDWALRGTFVTVARAQVNVERDLAALSGSAETEEAARFLVEVLLER